MFYAGKRRYNIKLWKTFTDCFNCLPVAAIIDEKIFCCHGGLSPDLQSMEQIRRIMRPTDVPDQGLLCDLLWSDPDKDVTGWGENDRGVSFTFGPEVVAKFLHKHDLDLICRAHQVRVHVSLHSHLCALRWSRTDTNSLPNDNLLRSSRRRIIAANSTTLVQ